MRRRVSLSSGIGNSRCLYLPQDVRLKTSTVEYAGHLAAKAEVLSMDGVFVFMKVGAEHPPHECLFTTVLSGETVAIQRPKVVRREMRYGQYRPSLVEGVAMGTRTVSLS